MKLPSREWLAQNPGHWSFGSPLHPNPKLYKSYWQVFTGDSMWEWHDFLKNCPYRSTSDCIHYLELLQQKTVSYIVYGRKRPRKHQGMPYDLRAEKWKNTQWAPALEDDVDPEWNGHK